MPVDQAVVVAVDAGALVLGEVLGALLLGVAFELEPGVAEVEAVGVVPVVALLRCSRGVDGRPALAGVDDEREPEHDDDGHDHGEQRSALESDLLALAGLRQLGGFLGG